MYRENHQENYPAHYQLLLLMELLDGQGISHHQYLKGTGLFYEDILSGLKVVSATQFIRFIENAQRLGDHTLAFRWGHMMLPGHYDVFTQLLHSTNNLHELLNVMQRYSEILCPMMSPVVFDSDQYSIIYWRDEMGVSSIQSFLVEAYSTALLSVCHWFAKEKYPWRLGFSTAEPLHIEEYRVNFGEDIEFDLGVNILAIKQAYLMQTWSNKTVSETVNHMLERKASSLHVCSRQGFIGAITAWYQAHISENHNLEQTAEAFNMSASTLKRKLKRHRTSFQKIQDQARLSKCLYLLHHKQWSNQQVSDYLQFSDAHNFRKAFKRWCGNTPNDMREKLQLKIRVA